MSGRMRKLAPWLATGVILIILLVITGFAVQKPAADKTATYVGSEACKECHDRIYATWRMTAHAQVVQDVRKNPEAIKGDFKNPDKTRTFDKGDVVYVSGLIWKQRYINKDWRVLPAQWNYETQKWAPYNVETWQKEDWRKECGYCHTTGFNRSKLNWKELGIGCEACHGPGSRHVENKKASVEVEQGQPPDIINPAALTADLAADVCGQCHTRGKSPDKNWSFPIDYKPGDQLTAKNFSPVPKTDLESWWPDGSVKKHRQQHIEWRESRHAKAGVNCVTCHDVHQSEFKFQTKSSQNNLCLGCHSQILTDAEKGHAPVGGTLRQHSDCVGCHMPRTGKSAEAGDEVSHRFKFIAPIATITLGGGDIKNQPNSCNICHPGAPVANLNADFAERLPFRARRP